MLDGNVSKVHVEKTRRNEHTGGRIKSEKKREDVGRREGVRRRRTRKGTSRRGEGRGEGHGGGCRRVMLDEDEGPVECIHIRMYPAHLLAGFSSQT